MTTAILIPETPGEGKRFLLRGASVPETAGTNKDNGKDEDTDNP
jgi:hypothetical protein